MASGYKPEESNASAAKRVRVTNKYVGEPYFADPDLDEVFTEFLINNSGIKAPNGSMPGISHYVVHMDQPDFDERAAEIFHREGIVVIPDMLTGERLEELRAAVNDATEEILAEDPTRSGTRNFKRYSLGFSMSTCSQLHRIGWARLLNLEALHKVLAAIWGTGYRARAYGCGGDTCLAGAYHHQMLHSDMASTPEAVDFPRAPAIACNFLLEDQTAINGPLRHIPRTQRTPIDAEYEYLGKRGGLKNFPWEEPNEWLLSTICPASAGTVLIRDIRAHHGGTPNLSTRDRPIPNIEFWSPDLVKLLAEKDKQQLQKPVMPYNIWEQLSEKGKEVSEFVKGGKGEVVSATVKPGVFDGQPFGNQRGMHAPLFGSCYKTFEPEVPQPLTEKGCSDLFLSQLPKVSPGGS